MKKYMVLFIGRYYYRRIPKKKKNVHNEQNSHSKYARAIVTSTIIQLQSIYIHVGMCAYLYIQA